jgi:hypothetical protein
MVSKGEQPFFFLTSKYSLPKIAALVDSRWEGVEVFGRVIRGERAKW